MTLPSIIVDLSIRGALAAGLLLALDLLAGRWMAARHRRLSWLLVALAFLLPVWFQLPLLPPRTANPLAAGLPRWEFPAALGAVSVRQALDPLLVIWILGMVGAAVLVAVRTIRAARLWNGSRFSTDAKLLELLEDCRSLAGVHAPVGVVVTDRISSPALMGWMRPKLLLPTGWLETCPAGQLRDVLLHELAHLRAADLAWEWLFLMVRVVHWFNPLAHVAALRWHAAREDAADEFVLRLRPADAGPYDETLLEFLKSRRSPQPFGALGISENFLNLKHRIQMIQLHPRRVLPATLVVLFLAAFTGGIFLRPTHAGTTDSDPKEAAVAAMTAWLDGIDKGDYAASWAGASKFFRRTLTQEQWVTALNQVRQLLGVCKERKLASELLQNGVPTPDGKTIKGEFVIAQFKSSFANLMAAVETVTFEHEADGTWRASGYYIKPAM